MATIAVTSRIEDESLEEDSLGKVYRRTYVVANVSGADAHFDALSVVPAYASPHSTQPNLFVSKRKTRPFAKNSRTQVYVDIEWRPPDFNLGETIIRYNATAREVQTNYDKDGKRIEVMYTAPGGQVMPVQVGLVRATESPGVLTFEFFTASDPSPFTAVRGKLNGDQFRGRPKYTWKNVDVTIEKIWSRSGWRVALAFEEHERDGGFMSVAAWRLNDGTIPSDIDDPDYTTESQDNGVTTSLTSKVFLYSGLALPQIGF